VRDPSGNSYIENPEAPKPDPNLTTVFFSRSDEYIHKQSPQLPPVALSPFWVFF